MALLGTTSMESSIQLAERFARLIARADYQAAHALLTEEARRRLAPADLEKGFQQMTGYAPGPVLYVEPVIRLYDWPEKKNEDFSFVHIALTGESYMEGISLILRMDVDGVRVNEVKWGRGM